MHNCRATIDRVTELLLNSPDARPDDLLAKELLRCAECRTEFDSLKQTLRITTQMIEKTEPSKSYWNAYHARLRRQLESATTTIHDFETREPSRFVRFKSSIRIPVPVGVALVLLFVVGLLFAPRVLQRAVVVTQTVSVPVPFEVPVVQEKIVTRIIYRDKRIGRARKRTENSTANGAVARSVRTQNDVRGALSGFKPLDEVKLTVIKGGSPDEK